MVRLRAGQFWPAQASLMLRSLSLRLAQLRSSSLSQRPPRGAASGTSDAVPGAAARAQAAAPSVPKRTRPSLGPLASAAETRPSLKPRCRTPLLVLVFSDVLCVCAREVFVYVCLCVLGFSCVGGGERACGVDRAFEDCGQASELGPRVEGERPPGVSCHARSLEVCRGCFGHSRHVVLRATKGCDASAE